MFFWGCVVVLLLTIKKIQMGSGHDACYPFVSCINGQLSMGFGGGFTFGVVIGVRIEGGGFLFRGR